MTNENTQGLVLYIRTARHAHWVAATEPIEIKEMADFLRDCGELEARGIFARTSLRVASFTTGDFESAVHARMRDGEFADRRIPILSLVAVLGPIPAHLKVDGRDGQVIVPLNRFSS